MTKNEQIRQSLLETREKRKSQECKVYSLKIQTNKLSKKQKESLKMMFIEGKWFWNHIVNFTETNDIKDVDLKIKSVKHFDKDHNEVISKFNYLSSQQKSGLYKNFISNIKTLSTLKKKGKKVGRIGYISDLKSLPLAQYGNTHKIVDHNKVKIVNVGTVKVQGLKQFIYDKDVEYANANFNKRINLTTEYQNEDLIKELKELNKKISKHDDILSIIAQALLYGVTKDTHSSYIDGIIRDSKNL